MMLLEFVAVGTVGFWVVLALAGIIMSELVDNNHPVVASLIAIGAVTGLVLLGNFSPITWILLNPMVTGLYVVGFFAIGAVWGVVKWFFWLRKARKQIEEISAVSGKDSYRLRDSGLPQSFPPKVSDYRGRILGWMMLWPASMVWTVLNDPVRGIFEEIFNLLGGRMQKISDYVFKDFKY